MSREVRTAADFQAAAGASAEQVAMLEAYKALLADWGDRMNLVGPSALQEFWGRHAWDCAQLFHVEHRCLTWADIGTGAGLPGVVLAILLKERPDARVHLVESQGKRVQFLQAVVDALGLPAAIHHARAEALPPLRVEVVTARACAPLDRLLGYTQAFFAVGARGVFLKGRDVEAELTQARRCWTFRSELIPSQSDPQGRILRIEGLHPRDRSR